MEWATENGWGARASQPGVRGDCVAVFGWATEAQYLFARYAFEELGWARTTMPAIAESVP